MITSFNVSSAMARILVALSLLLLFFSPLVSAGLDSSSEGGELWFSCESANECTLTRFQVGEDVVSGTITQASPFSPSRVLIELPMFPEQTELALIPDVIAELQIDLRYQDDFAGLTRPDTKVTIIVDQVITEIEFEGDQNPTDGMDGAYRVEDEPLNLNGDRLLWPNEKIKILLEFDVERSGTWELHLRGASFMKLEIIWSEDLNSRDVDEPSSDSSPVQSEFDVNHKGALVEDDRDCWSFEIQEHEVMRATFFWEVVPAEIEQSHGQPDLILPDRRLAPTPELISTSSSEELRLTWQWRALPTGTHTLCIGGKLNAFQPYQWSGILAVEGIGPTDPSQFDGDASYPAGFAIAGDKSQKVELNAAAGSMVLILSIAIMMGLAIEVRQDSTSNPVRYGILVPGVLILLIGGVISPVWSMAGETQYSDELNFDQMVDQRLDQLWHASHPGTPASSRALHVGSSLGILEGDTLRLRLEVDEAYPLDDGRFQLHIPALDSLDIGKLVFAKIAAKGGVDSGGELLDDHAGTFALLAARTLLIDLILLEGLMVVDELPVSNVVHIRMDMVSSTGLGIVQDPTWATKPADISEGRWRGFQDELYPSSLVVSLCTNCGVDKLDILVKSDGDINSERMVSSSAIQPVTPLVGNQNIWVMVGIGLSLTAIWLENKRRAKAKRLVMEIAANNLWD